MTSTSSAKKPTLQANFSTYWNQGIAVIPEINAIPIKGLAWSEIYKSNWKPSAEDLLDYDLADDYGMALVTGAPSGIVVADIEVTNEEQIKKVIELLGDSRCKKVGSKGISIFYKYNNERNENWGKNGTLYAELLSTGRKTTIPPSLHRKTKKPYRWIGEPLIECYKDLPTLPANYSEILCSLFSIIKEPPQEYPKQHYDIKPTFAEACKALSYCDSNASNDDWIRIGMAFKSEVGDAGFAEFDSWSSKGKSYDKHSIRSRWRSFNGHSIGYGTLVYYAKQGGYAPPQAEIKTYTATEVEDWSKKELERKAELVQKSNELPEFYTKAPDHIKVITDWILSTSLYPQPIITLGSVLGFLGFIMGRDFEYKSLKANLYVANVAYSADGKEHINRCIRGLMHQAGLMKNISYGWTSDTAIIEKLSNSEGKAFYLTDELQAALRAIANKSTNSREAAAVEVFLQAYTGIEVRTADYADSKDRPTKIVKNPFISICGYTTPAIFEMCLGSTEVFSGFVGRLTVFRGNEYIPEENLDYNGNAWKNPPLQVTDILQGVWANRQKERLPDGSFTYGTKEIPTQCEKLIRDYREKIRLKRNEMRMSGEGIEPVFGRAAEMMLKYAIIASQGREIKEEHIHWAISVVEYNLSIICEVAKGFSDNKFERNKAKLLQFIQGRGGIADKTIICTHFRGFENSRDRKEALDDLVDSGKLEVLQDKTTGRTKVLYRVLSELPSQAG